MSHVELKIINEEVYFIEAGARAGGDHIADTLVPLSTNFDMYKAAIECCFGRFNPCNIKTVAYSGIYFHCKQNEALTPRYLKLHKQQAGVFKILLLVKVIMMYHLMLKQLILDL